MVGNVVVVLYSPRITRLKGGHTNVARSEVAGKRRALLPLQKLQDLQGGTHRI